MDGVVGPSRMSRSLGPLPYASRRGPSARESFRVAAALRAWARGPLGKADDEDL